MTKTLYPYRLISSYADAETSTGLYDEEFQFLEQADYDLEFAGAALLGFDARQLCSLSTLGRVRNILAQLDFAERLAERIRLSRWPLRPERLPRILSVLLRS